MSGHEILPGRHAAYWNARVFEETEAALACDDPWVAAIHVELATHCLKMAQQERSRAPVASPPA